PLWWDEGWTLCVARQWVETGHYGCLLEGRPAPPLLAGHFPVVASIAAGFRLFGIGIWQARLVELLYAFAALGLLYYLTAELYSPKVALGTIVMVLFFPVNWEMHPLIIGRQVLGEMPMVCFLLAGYVCMLLVERHVAWLGGTVGCWGLALFTKLQVRPFWILSLAVPILLSVWRREWGMAGLLGSAAAGSWAVFSLLGWLKSMWLQGHTMAMPPMSGLLQVSAIVLVPMIRLGAVLFALTYLVPTMCGLTYATGRLVSQWRRRAPFGLIDAVRAMLLTFCLGWCAWFLALSLGGGRYAFPLWFLAAPFAVALLCDWSHGYDIRVLVRSLGSIIRTRRAGSIQIQHVSVVLLVFIIVGMAVQARYAFRAREDGTAFHRAIAFLHSHVPLDALIETYESELLFLLPMPYHYPPAALDVGLIRKSWETELQLTYDPLDADPDYVVVGEFGRRAGIYRSPVETGQIRLLHKVGRYQIYERVRP
ncbi:MAG: hypothetical protein M3M98_00490, partial [Nitrospirota bacterium]|nr:hypothetical protein [Nitrospirota bacterium]